MVDSLANLFCVYLNQDDPKKNTILRLAKFREIKIKKKIIHCPRKAIILDPFASKAISPEDYSIILKYGLIVIDCSWNKTETIFKKQFQYGRKLPHLLAANAVNYGKWERLSSAEALAAALYVTGFKEQAKDILSIFSWGSEFFKINKLN